MATKKAKETKTTKPAKAKPANTQNAAAPAATDGGQPRAKQALKLPRAVLMDLYQARRYLGLETHKATGLRIPVDVYFKDPRVAEVSKKVGIDKEFTTPWEPGLRDGPTSARFAVVDYDATNNTLTPPAVWDEDNKCYRAPDNTVLDGNAVALPQYHQLAVWATVQNTLDFFESSAGL